MEFDVISVIGLGYIGLPTAAAFAARRKQVIGVDVNQRTVDTINKGAIHIVEPELDMLVHAAVTQGYRVITFFAVQHIYSLAELGHTASSMAIAQMLGFFTAIGWAALVLVRVPGAAN